MEIRNDLTVGLLLSETAEKFPDRTALKNKDGSYTYKQLDAAVDDTAKRLLSCGIKRGDHVGILCETSFAEIILIFSLARIGAVAVMFNTSLGSGELTTLINRSRTSAIFCGDGYKSVSFPLVLRSIMPDCPELKEVFFAGAGNSLGFRELRDIEPASDAELEAAKGRVLPGDTVQIVFTSGTTSMPKMVMTSQLSRANCGVMQAKDLAATEEDVFLCALPVFHCFGMSVNLMASVAAGACLYLPPSRKTAVLLTSIEDQHCTVLNCVPTLFFAMMHRPDFSSWDLSSLRAGFIGGSFTPPSQFKAIENAFGFTLISSLGQTEATGGVTTTNITDPLELRAESVGHFMDHVEGKIADIHDGSPCPPGVIGEICIRGYVVMQGYYGMPEETARAIDGDGWLHTGDCGFMGEDGYVRLSGRIKDIIIRGGENISPAEIEDIVMTNSCVEKCKAIGVYSPHYGEEICLCIVTRDGQIVSPEIVLSELKTRLADFKIPKYVLFFDSFPEKNTGKIETASLKAEAHKMLGIKVPV